VCVCVFLCVRVSLCVCVCVCACARRAHDLIPTSDAAQHHFAEAASYIESNIGASHPLASEVSPPPPLPPSLPLPPSPPLTHPRRQAFLGLGNLLYQRAKYEDAEKAIRKAMSIRQIALGATHPSFAEAGMPKEPSKRPIEYRYSEETC
jgi:hypothetical protein